MTFEELIALHQSHLQSLHRHASTRSNQRAVTGDFARFCQRELGLADPRELRPEHVAAYLRELAGRPLTPLVRYSRFNLVRAWLAWAAYQGHILSDPGRDFQQRHPPHLPRGAPTEEQVQRFLATPDDSLRGRCDQALLEFLYGTGARLGETLAMDVGDLQLTLRQAVIRFGKCGSSRVVPLGRRLLVVLERYLAEVRPDVADAGETALWLGLHGRRLRTVPANTRIRRWAREAGLPITAHSLRHACATHLLARGAPIVAIQRLLGHVTLNMTSRYLHLVAADVRQALEQHHPRGRRQPRPRKR